MTDRRPLHAKKSLGQNFCIDDRIPAEIAERLKADASCTIWEIGPGKGALTRVLNLSGARLHLFEIDLRMKETLSRRFPNAEITWGDFLELEDSQLPEFSGNLLVTGNLPYYCGTPIIKRFLENGPAATRLVFLLQHEVAEKAAAGVEHREYGYLSVHTALFARAIVGSIFGPASFDPPPKVKSAILEIEPLPLNAEEKLIRANALKHVSQLFNQRRKMALPLLKRQHPDIDWAARFTKLGIDEKARPENISPQQFLQLFSGS